MTVTREQVFALAEEEAVARAIKAGTVSVNDFSEGDITTPFWCL
jgi:hypothetical protein